MYCRMCGNKLGDNDQYCQNCGASAIMTEAATGAAENNEPKEEVVFNPPFESTSPFTAAEETPQEELAAADLVEDLGGFISDKEIQDANLAQEEKDSAEAPEEKIPEKATEFAWNIHEFPGSKKRTDNTEFNWNMEEFSPNANQPEAEAAIERELFQEMRQDADKIREQNIDRFFTFSRKNEEFQELLDREYEKIKYRPEPGMAIQSELITEPLVPEEAIHEEAAIDPEVPVVLENTEADSEEDTHAEPEADDFEASYYAEPEAIEEIAEDVIVSDSFEEVSPEVKPYEAAPKAEHLSEMALARAEFFGENLVRDNDSIVKTLHEDATVQSIAEENIEETPALTEDATKEISEPVSEEAAIPVNYNEKESKRGKITGGQIALVIIAIILAAEIGILGIRYFAPESGAAAAIGNVQTQVIGTVSGWFESKPKETDQTKEEATQESNDQTTNENQTTTESSVTEDQTGTEEPAETTPSVPAADPAPMADKNALVATQLGLNANIEQVKANEALAWQSGKNYGVSDINSSVPITNNIWQAPETGDPVYYDKSIVGAVIAFDSKWIDYVNTGDKGVLDLLKTDSVAYKNTLAYKKVGKIKETFKLLEIGEIRQGSKGYYVWVHEEIQITENGATTNKKYNWIYSLEPADGKMKIVNYLKF